MPALPYRSRFLLLALAALSLFAALWTGIVRLGWNIPVPNAAFSSLHGPLMVVGFLGTLIGLERAVAFRRIWPYAIPVCSGLSGLSALLGFSLELSATLAAFASVLLIAVFAALYRQYPSEHFILMALSALAWSVGNILWLKGAPLFAVAPWWAAFLVMMIAGERLELTRLRRPSAKIRALLHGSVALSFLGLSVFFWNAQLGIRVAGAGFLFTALWLLRYDLAWRSLREAGLPRFMAASLLPGYAWLAVGGILWVVFAPVFRAGPYYDAMLHSIFLGFIFSMIFAHAPVIFPSITNIALPFQRLFYIHLALLHLSVLMRVGGGLMSCASAQRWGGLLNGFAIVIFLLNNVRAVRISARTPSKAG